MKTKAFLFVCLFMGIALTQVTAQNNQNGTGSDTFTAAALGWEAYVYCGGVEVDVIGGYGDAHIINHFKAGEWQFQILTVKGVGQSYETGESFTFSEQDKIFVSPKVGDYIWTCHTNIKGDKGTMYNVSLIINPYDGTFVVKNATCTGNSK
jgi:hypothetical protein